MGTRWKGWACWVHELPGIFRFLTRVPQLHSPLGALRGLRRLPLALAQQHSCHQVESRTFHPTQGAQP